MGAGGEGEKKGSGREGVKNRWFQGGPGGGVGNERNKRVVPRVEGT